MLTRIEIDGFKNLLGFSAEFGPFTCIAGPNAVGKSNLFDAIEFLSLLSQHPLDKAASMVRATPGTYEPAQSLFWNDGEIWADRIRIAVELLIDGWVIDDLGRGYLPDNPRYRYEIELQLDGGLRLASERLIGLESNTIRFPHHASFARAHRLDRIRDRKVIFDLDERIMPDGSAAPDLTRATRPVLQLYQTVEHAEILAVRSELASWRRFALNPSELRKPHEIGSANRVSDSGEHLPLLFMQLVRPEYPNLSIAEDGDESSAFSSLSARVITKLGRIAGLRAVMLHEDTERGILAIQSESRSGEILSARMMSEGSLRALALVLLGLQSGDRTLCIEEPENGFHPSHCDELVRILNDLAIDPCVDVSEDLAELDRYDSPPLRQAIITTHSPDLVRRIFEARKGDLLMATSASISGPKGRAAQVLRVQPLRNTWRCHDGVKGVMLPMLAYMDYAALNPRDADTVSAVEDK
jgi:predicted ATPase